MILIRELTNTTNLVHLFPYDAQTMIHRNLSNFYKAWYLVGYGEVIGAGGFRQNEQGLWVAWVWISANGKSFILTLIRTMKDYIRLVQEDWGDDLYAVVNTHNRQGRRLVEMLGFTLDGMYENYRDTSLNLWMYRKAA